MERTQLLEIANKYGSPVYVYDTDKIEAQYNRLTNAFSTVKNLKLNYAVKALSNVNILKFLQHIGAGLDTVSIQEVQLGLTTGIDPKKIIFTPNGVSLTEIEAPFPTNKWLHFSTYSEGNKPKTIPKLPLLVLEYQDKINFANLHKLYEFIKKLEV